MLQTHSAAFAQILLTGTLGDTYTTNKKVPLLCLRLSLSASFIIGHVVIHVIHVTSYDIGTCPCNFM
jgi:hypothetical protein